MFKSSELVLGFLFATAIWVCVLALQARPTAALFRIDDYSALVTALATIAIAAFTFTLWKSTDKLWKAGEDQFRLAKETSDRQASEIQDQLTIAREASQAAQKSADAAVAAERAWLYVQIEYESFMKCIQMANALENEETEDMPIGRTPDASIKFKNYGKTPAIIIEVGISIAYSELLVPDPVYDVKLVRGNNIIAPDQASEVFSALFGQQMTLGQAKKVRDGNGSIWVAGYVSYDDVFNERRIHRFLQRYVCVVPRQHYVLQAYDFKHYNVSS